MSYKFTPKIRIIDGLIICLCVFAFSLSPKMGTSEHYLVLLTVGILMIRYAYLVGSRLYGENAEKNPTTLFKIRKVVATFCVVAALVLYFIYIFNWVL